MAKIAISSNLYKKILKFAEKLSQESGRKISVDEAVALSLKFGLQNDEIMQKALKEALQKNLHFPQMNKYRII